MYAQQRTAFPVSTVICVLLCVQALGLSITLAIQIPEVLAEVRSLCLFCLSISVIFSELSENCIVCLVLCIKSSQ
jgi:hypothetical protein